MISSSTPNPVKPVGSTVTLTCTVHVELSPLIDVPVTVNIVVAPWRGLFDGSSATNTSQLVMEDTTVYTLTDMVSSFGRNQSGFYICRATLYSALNNTYIDRSFQYLSVVEATTGEILCPLYFISKH